MTIKTIIFCDYCNPQCIRSIDRRSSYVERPIESRGRRFSDDRSWLECSILDDSSGWVLGSGGKDLCPRCVKVVQTDKEPAEINC